MVPRHIRPYDEYVFFIGDDNMFSLIYFVIVFIIVYFAYYFIFDDMLKKEKYAKISELVLLTKKFNLDKKKMNYRSSFNGIAILNAFIMGSTVVVVDLIPFNYVSKLLVAFVMIMILMFSLYFLYGKYLSKK